ncbi:MAG: NAD+ synthase [Planctomycetes bacterium]|nr:NAD+ synthase [Planctomycetota bacterium]
MKIALAQINPTVGDIDANAARIIRRIEAARDAGAHLVVTSELAVFGYPPKDLLLRRDLIRKNLEALDRIAAACKGTTAVVGYVQPDPSGAGTGVFNAAAVCRAGRVLATYAKMLLPTYDVFDETRYFNAGQDVCTFEVPTDGEPVTIGLSICEDLWNDEQFEGRRVYRTDPIERTVNAGAQWVINLSASPYRAGVQQRREALFIHQVKKYGVPLLSVNQVGGNDDLLFDGASLALDASGGIIARAKAFDEDLLVFESDPQNPTTARIESYPQRIDSIRLALILGIRDYIRKCGFEKVLVGLSGGIDSALTAVLAVDALSAQHVHGVAMPSRYSSKHSVEDAKRLADNLGIECTIIPIEAVHRAMEEAVRPCLGDQPPGVAEENIQARVRGNILMALSNKFGWLLLTTGNKSELAVGYCTLYGDMCGGLAVLSDVPKTTVYRLAKRINEEAGRDLIPQRTIEKAPSAELRENQTDQDTLPPYDLLDAVLEHYVEQDLCAEEIVALGFDRVIVERVAGMVDRNEYKRKQAPVGLKVTSRAFGTGRRMPIAARFT